MRMKYIMFELEEAGIKRVVPFLFFEPVTHIETFKALRRMFLDRAELRSAGFISFTDVGAQCFGESESLKQIGELGCKALPGDGKIIALYNYTHGLL